MAICGSLFAQEPLEEKNVGVPSQNKTLYQADLIRESLRKEQYSDAISQTQKLLGELKSARQQRISTFFPKTFADYRIEVGAQNGGYFAHVGDEFGVIWIRHYAGKNDHKVDVNVVFQDPSIQDYARTMASPALVKSLPNTKLVTLEGGQKALQKSNDQEGYYEMNIVLSKDILINILSTGKSSPQDARLLLSMVEFEGLKQFLEK